MKWPRTLGASVAIAATLVARPVAAQPHDTAMPAVLWTPPADIAERDLLHGPGGEAAAPRGPMRLLDGALGGTAPKIRLRDGGGQTWIAKLGSEARPETAASRLLWAVGYAADVGYFMAELAIDGPAGGVDGGVLREVRLERARTPAEAQATWRWRDNPFVGSRAFDGLRVMMALVNNWDLKDDNNVVYLQSGPRGPVAVYEVGDLGATFGTAGYGWRERASKGNLVAYRRSAFIRDLTASAVDFEVPAWPSLVSLFDLPRFIERMRMRWIGRGIPRVHARWIGTWLARLSVTQLRDAFRAAGFTPREVDGYAAVLRARIARLSAL